MKTSRKRGASDLLADKGRIYRAPPVFDSKGDAILPDKDGKPNIKRGGYYIPAVRLKATLCSFLRTTSVRYDTTLEYLSIREWNFDQVPSYKELDRKLKKKKIKVESLKRRVKQLESESIRENVKWWTMKDKIRMIDARITRFKDQESSVGQVRAVLENEISEAKKRKLRLCDDFMRLEDQKERLDLMCFICKEHVITTALLPCRHLSFCEGCAQGIIDRNERCPFCKHQVLFHETFFVK
jgi:hypothetical protein